MDSHLVSSFLRPRGYFQNLANLSKKHETEYCKCRQSNVQSRNWFLNCLQLSITGLKWLKTVKMASTYDCGLGSPWRTFWVLSYLFLNHPAPSSFPVHRSWAHKSRLGAPSPKHLHLLLWLVCVDMTWQILLGLVTTLWLSRCSAQSSISNLILEDGYCCLL